MHMLVCVCTRARGYDVVGQHSQVIKVLVLYLKFCRRDIPI